MRRTLHAIFVLAFLGMLLVNLGNAQELSVKEMVFCSSVVDRQPVNIDTTFANDVERIYCFTKIHGATVPGAIKHIWYHNDEKRAEIELNVKADPWRTWSSKKIVPSWTGTWKVEVVGDKGNVLISKSFSVIKK